MKALKCIKYLFLIAFAATLTFSCSKDEFDEDELGTFESTTIDKREAKDIYDINSDDDVANMPPNCEIEICVVITPNTTNTYQDIYIAEIPGIGNIVIQSGVVTLPDGTSFPLVNNEYCGNVPVFGTVSGTLKFKGYGAAVTTATWPDGTACEIFSAGVGTIAGVSKVEDYVLDCNPICAPPVPDCFIEVCVEITPNTTNTYQDIYIAEIPGIGNIVIQSGVVTLPDGTSFPLVNNEFCGNIPVFGSISGTLKFKGYGAAVTTATWPDGTACEIFSAGVGTTAGVSKVEDYVLDCDPICIPPVPDCFIEVCVEITPNTTNTYQDIYIAEIPGIGNIVIQSGVVTLPDGTSFPLVNNEFCGNIPVFGSISGTLKFKGYGAAVTTATWPDGTACQIFSAGVGTTAGVSKVEDYDLDCNPIC